MASLYKLHEHGDNPIDNDNARWREFGTSIDMEGNHVMIGAPREETAGQNKFGAGYLYTWLGRPQADANKAAIVSISAIQWACSD